MTPIVIADEKEDSLNYYFQRLSVAYESGDYQNALQYFDNTLRLYKELSGDVSQDTVYASIAGAYAGLCYQIGDYENTTRLGSEITSIYKAVYGNNSIQYANSLSDLTLCYHSIGNYTEAIRLTTEAMIIRKKVLGTEHPDYATSVGNLASCYSSLGNYDEAIRLGTEAMEIRKRVLGTDNPDYATSLSNLASYYSSIGNYDEAIRLGTEAMEIRKRVLGTDHPDYVLALNNLAIFYAFLGNYNEAIRLGIEEMEIRKRVLGADNPDYATSLSNLASYYSSLGNYDEAIRLGTEAMEIQKRVLGTDHPNYTTSLSNLASYYSSLGNYDEAIRLGTEAMEIQKRVLGADHPNYATSLNNLATYYYYLGNYIAAIQFGSQALEIRKRVLGTNHPDYANSLNNLASCYSSLANYNEAIRLGIEEMEIRKRVLGTDHPDYATSLSNLAESYSSLGNYDEAIRLGTEAVEMKKRLLGINHPDYAMTLNNLALYYFYLGNNIEAIRLGTKAMEIKKRVLGTDHPDYATSLSNLAGYYYSLGNYGEAIRLGAEAVKIRKRVLGTDNSDYAMALNNLALYYSSFGNKNEAIRLGNEAMEIKKRVLGSDHPDYARSLNNVANLYSYTGNDNEAIRLGTKALEIEKKVFGSNHPDYAMTINNLASYYSSIGNYDEAIRLGTEAMEIRKRVLGTDHPDYATSLRDLTYYYSTTGNFIEALPLLNQYISIVRNNVLNTFSGLTANERQMYWDKYKFDLNQWIPEILISSGTPHASSALYDNTALFAKGLLLSAELEMTKLIQESGDDDALQMYSSLRENRQILTMQYSKPIANRHIDCDSLERVSSAIERQLISRVKNFGDYTRHLKITWQDVQSKLEDSDVAIEFISFPRNDDTTVYAARTLCKNDTAPVLTLLFTELELIKASGDDMTYLTSKADSLIWGPLLPRLEGKTHVHFSASGLLHNIGIEYLPSMEGKDCHRLSSTRELVTHKPSPALGSSTTATLYGYIDYNATYSSIDSITANSAYYSSSPLNIDLAQSSEQSLSEVNDSIATYDDNNLPATIDSPGSMGYDILLPGVNQNRGGFDYRSLRYEVDSLPGSRVEVQTISTLLDSIDVAYVPLMTNQASEESFKALSEQRKSLIHISTHGFYYDKEEAENKAEHMRRMLLGDDRPTHVEDQSLLRCGLCFAGANQTFKGESQPSDGQDDGVLNALEIAQTDLRGLDLVVLSACQTGLGDIVNGEGVFGLQRGFKKAGAQSILMSLWEVDDKVTQILMTEFYRAWTSGMNKTAALKKAQSIVKEKYPDPKHWASFILLDAID